MALDKVHHLQQVFRQFVTAHSFPGRILSVRNVLEELDSGLVLAPHMILPALVLLDAETSFAVPGDRGGDSARLLGQLTYARAVRPEDAAFLFVGNHRNLRLSALAAAREGSLENPHHGATLVMDLSFFGSDDSANILSDPETEIPDSDELCEWGISGPGIPGERNLVLSGGSDWVRLRNQRNSEFPLGLDLILTDNRGALCALPRSTRIEQTGKVR